MWSSWLGRDGSPSPRGCGRNSRNDNPGAPTWRTAWIQTGRAQRAGDLEANSTAGCWADYYRGRFFQRLQRLSAFRHAPGANGPEHFQKSVTRFSLQKRAALLQQFASKSRDDGGFNLSVERL